MVVHIYRTVNDELADVTREVWDDEEDVAAAAAQLGFDRDSSAAEAGPLMSEVNEWYVEKQYPKESYLGQLELRFVPGRGYGLYATQHIPQGSVVAVALPLAWVAGPPGAPPPLESLVALLRGGGGGGGGGRDSSSSSSSVVWTAQQRRVLASLCSSPELDGSHQAGLEAQQQEMQQVCVRR